METVRPLIETTLDGSPTLRHPLVGETYHSLRGALGESEHVFIGQGLLWKLEQQDEKQKLRILEVGFGSGLNAWLSAREAAGRNIPIYYEAIEPYPVEESVIEALDYAADPLFLSLHRAGWEEPVRISDRFTLCKRVVELDRAALDPDFDLIYFDAFAPEIQPELWTVEVFRQLYACLAPGGALVTYSSKGTVKQNLRAAGFDLRRLSGALGKRHMLRAVKPE